ncbi:hypothetical protein [Spongiactinospora sp. TRM90649]|uniref:hypothetical protein n=1 Tax=Spongiactinospora sp. TRM90649 TaxID=3031114 RepID=UPI0023F8CAA2|nr:hypothetical protein [Spongiactinospora sp. TRM90649]MDF5758585.1 hypothetical protein [Spongiactinospora sp. TRM90649]
MTATNPVREHGTPARYRHGPDINDRPGKGCRCPQCRAANAADLAAWRRRKALEQWGATPAALVDAAPARAHVRRLMAYGIGWERVAELAGVGNGTVGRLLYGAGGEAPTVRVRRETAARLLAVQPSPDLLCDGRRVDAAGTRRRVQALAAIGWTLSDQARRLGWEPRNLWGLANTRTRVAAATARAVCGLYAELSMRPGEGPTAARAKRMATARGWLPPLAWDDELIDLPDAEMEAALARRAAAMDEEELSRCWTARYRHGETSPLIVAGVRERLRRRKQLEKTAKLGVPA